MLKFYHLSELKSSIFVKESRSLFAFGEFMFAGEFIRRLVRRSALVRRSLGEGGSGVGSFNEGGRQGMSAPHQNYPALWTMAKTFCFEHLKFVFWICFGACPPVADSSLWHQPSRRKASLTGLTGEFRIFQFSVLQSFNYLFFLLDFATILS